MYKVIILREQRVDRCSTKIIRLNYYGHQHTINLQQVETQRVGHQRKNKWYQSQKCFKENELISMYRIKMTHHSSTMSCMFRTLIRSRNRMKTEVAHKGSTTSEIVTQQVLKRVKRPKATCLIQECSTKAHRLGDSSNNKTQTGKANKARPQWEPHGLIKQMLTLVQPNSWVKSHGSRNNKLKDQETQMFQMHRIVKKGLVWHKLSNLRVETTSDWIYRV